MSKDNLDQVSDTSEIDAPDVEVSIEDDAPPAGKQPPANDVHDEDDAEARRLKRKQENKERQQRQRAARQRTEEELEELRAEREAQHREMMQMKQRLDQLNGMATQYQTQTITKDIQESERILRYYDDQLEAAISSADGAAVRNVLKAREDR